MLMRRSWRNTLARVSHDAVFRPRDLDAFLGPLRHVRRWWSVVLEVSSAEVSLSGVLYSYEVPEGSAKRDARIARRRLSRDQVRSSAGQLVCGLVRVGVTLVECAKAASAYPRESFHGSWARLVDNHVMKRDSFGHFEQISD